ncbi:MAG: hypothetical protein JXL80_07390 [Planctomycetes bacterium]|nr:hypothetical protein [Planctomycetota bacterium]
MRRITPASVVLLTMALWFTAAPAAQAADLDLDHADFHARLGITIYVHVGEGAGGKSLKAVLTSDKGLEKTIAEKKGLKGVEPVTLILRELPAAKYTLAISLSDGRKAVRTWEKPYDGAPRVGVDENNAICVEGKPFFPVCPWCVTDESEIKEWSPYINTLHGMGFKKDQWTLDGFRKVLDLAAKHNMKVIGPVRGSYWPRGGAETGTCYYKNEAGKKVKEKIADHVAMAEYVEVLKNHPALLLWNWHDEPELDNGDNCNPPEEVRKWTLLAHEHDSQHPVMLNTGGKFARPMDNWAIAHIKRYTYEFNGIPGPQKVLLADVISQDYYPVESGNDPNYPGTFETMCTSMDRMVQWNRNLTAFLACVETCDIRADGDAPPTPAELRLICWGNIIHGARGLTWFHYFNPTPKENFAEMARFLKQITALTPAVCAAKYEGDIEKKETADGRVDFMATELDGQIYVFAANVLRKATKATFTLDFAAKKVEVVDENRTVAAKGKTFTDSFEPLAVHIYRISK